MVQLGLCCLPPFCAESLPASIGRKHFSAVGLQLVKCPLLTTTLDLNRAEGAIVLSYPEHRKRGRYLAIWLMFKNSGQIIGGCVSWTYSFAQSSPISLRAINLGTNIHRSTGGKVNYDTLLAFVALQCLGLPFALLISNPQKVQREDGTKVVIDTKTSTTVQLRALWRTVSTRKVGVLLPIFFSSWFYWGYASSFLTLYFSVRYTLLCFGRTLLTFFSCIRFVRAPWRLS